METSQLAGNDSSLNPWKAAGESDRPDPSKTDAPTVTASGSQVEPPAEWLKKTLTQFSWTTAGITGVSTALLARSAAQVTDPRHQAERERQRQIRQQVWTTQDIARVLRLVRERDELIAAKRRKNRPGTASKVFKALIASTLASAQAKAHAKAEQQKHTDAAALQSGLQRAGVVPRPGDGTPPMNQAVQGQPVPAGTQRKPRQRAFSWWGLLKHTYSDWSEDKASRLGAALAYYTVFSIAPLLVIVLAVAGYFLGPDAVQGELHTQLSGLLGDEGAQGVEAMVASASKRTEGITATVVSIVVLLFGATGVFTQMKDSLNTIWEVEPRKDLGWWATIKDRFLSFAMILGIAFLLLVSLVISTALGAMMKMFGDIIPGPDIVAHMVDIVVSLIVTTLLFALIFKFLPDIKIRWKDVWIGAFVTAVLFAIGKYAIGLYLGNAALSSSYGAAASIIIVMLWAYYSSQILFLGAEFTEVYASMTGGRILPDDDALPLTPERDPRQQPVAA